MDFKADFKQKRITNQGVGIHVRIAGSGFPILLLHGYPQTGYMWHKVAPLLARDFSVVIADLRGYGDSDKPKTDQNHSPYSKRSMAGDMREVMGKLGYKTFAVAGHDRGGRVAHRMARDYPDTITHVALLDIVPTLAMYEKTNKKFATSYYHWFFLIQPSPFPETLIKRDPEFFLKHKTNHWGRTAGAITDEAFSEYLRCFSDPRTIHATCEDYRASASIDLEHDQNDFFKKSEMPILVLWGDAGFVGQNYNVICEWKAVAADVQGHSVPGGHFLAEEAPSETAEALINFFSKAK